jgi:hypothetical protein
LNAREAWKPSAKEITQHDGKISSQRVPVTAPFVWARFHPGHVGIFPAMRIRTIKPEFFNHTGIFDAEIETGLPLRIAYIGLWCAADREGRFRWDPRRLKVEIMPYDDVDFSRVLDALATRGFVVKYRVMDACFGSIPSFAKHQVINNRESASKLPDYMGETAEILEISKTSDACPTREAREDHASKAEGKGREGKGIIPSGLPEGSGEQELPLTDPEKQKAPRKRNELLDALLSECGIENPTRTQFSMGNKFLAEIKAVDPEVTVQQIRQFCSQKRSEWRGLDFTPAAVAKHWKAPSRPGNGHPTAEATPENPFPGTGTVTLAMIRAKFQGGQEQYRWMMEMEEQGRFER